MKLFLAAFLALFLAAPTFAAYSGPTGADPGFKGSVTGFKGPVSGSQAQNVAEALKLEDNARVSLVGNITSKLAGSKNEYMFRDATGEIAVEIDNKVFRALGVEVTPETTVRISGKMDKDFAKNPEIEVRVLEIVQ